MYVYVQVNSSVTNKRLNRAKFSMPAKMYIFHDNEKFEFYQVIITSVGKLFIVLFFVAKFIKFQSSQTFNAHNNMQLCTITYKRNYKLFMRCNESHYAIQYLGLQCWTYVWHKNLYRWV